MEMERRQSMVTKKKAWKTIRIVLYMLTKGIACKSKLIAELLKRAKLAAAEAIANTLTLRHNYSSTAAISPRDYEFSCSNSPAVFPKFRNNKHHHRHHQHQHKYDDVLKVLEILNNNRNECENYSSPSSMVALPGFGKSPIGSKLIRITDSPFPMKADEGDYDGHVDIAAEEFIKRFYKQLNLQQNLVSIQSPSPYYHNSSRDR